MLVVTATRARVLCGLVIRVLRLCFWYQVCYAGVNGHACGVQRCVCLIPRGRGCPDTCLTHCVDCLGSRIIMAIPLVIAVVSLTPFTKMRLVRIEIFPFAMRLICMLTWQSIKQGRGRHRCRLEGRGLLIWLDLASTPYLLIRGGCGGFPLICHCLDGGMVVSLCHHLRISLPSVGIDHVLEETIT